MRRFLLLLLVLGAFLALGITASAESMARDVRVDAVVADDGSCQVTLAATLYIEQADKSLTFPIPSNARAVTLNGGTAPTHRSGGSLNVELSRMVGNMTGEMSIVLRYTLPGVVAYDEQDRPMLTLPLLSGFSYPTEILSFTVTLPEAVVNAPSFSSGYHQQSIEEALTWEKSAGQITGEILTQLKDHETLTMTLEVTEETFPRNAVEPWSAGFEDIALFVMAGLAALYWLVFLRCAPLLARRCVSPPEGCTAGELGCALTGQGADLTMMVLSWARLGYILIHLEDSGRVILHKRMEMGNERGSFENKLFRSLFGRKKMVDGTGYHYATLCRKAAASRGSMQQMYLRSSGNPRVFRILAAVAGVFAGASLGLAMAEGALLMVLVAIIMGLLGGLASWVIQGWAKGLHLRGRISLYAALACAAVWVLVGFLVGEQGIAIGTVLGQFLAGLAATYGGRRTEAGRQTACQILGLRRFLASSREDLRPMLQADPDLFFDMVPYAMALGVDKAFAKRFGHKRLNACPWLTTGMDGHMTAAEWDREMRRAAEALDHRQRRLPLERLMGR